MDLTLLIRFFRTAIFQLHSLLISACFDFPFSPVPFQQPFLPAPGTSDNEIVGGWFCRARSREPFFPDIFFFPALSPLRSLSLGGVLGSSENNRDPREDSICSGLVPLGASFRSFSSYLSDSTGLPLQIERSRFSAGSQVVLFGAFRFYDKENFPGFSCLPSRGFPQQKSFFFFR